MKLIKYYWLKDGTTKEAILSKFNAYYLVGVWDHNDVKTEHKFYEFWQANRWLVENGFMIENLTDIDSSRLRDSKR